MRLFLLLDMMSEMRAGGGEWIEPSMADQLTQVMDKKDIECSRLGVYTKNKR